MLNVDAARSVNLASIIPISFRNMAIGLAPVATAFFLRPTPVPHFSSSQNFLRTSSIFLRESPRFFEKRPPSLFAAHPLMMGILILGGALLIHQLLNQNHLRPAPDCERIGQTCPIAPLPLLAP